MTHATELSVIIPALNEGPNLAQLLPGLRRILRAIGASYEILIITRAPDPQTLEAADAAGAKVIEQRERGYGGALLAGFAAARGHHLLTMDADLSHSSTFVAALWARRRDADVIIASRYVSGGRARMPAARYFLSRLLNLFFGRGLSLPVRDMSSGFRLYHGDAIRGLELTARDFDILQEILVRAAADGRTIKEIPFQYLPRVHGSSNARVLRFGLAYLRTFFSMWKLRNSIAAADYDDRAFDSPIPLQRYWQRTRFRHITDLMDGQSQVLDVGCGSSRILSALPTGSVALDILPRKLRHARKFGHLLVCGSAFALPFRDAAFTCVVCSEVIEHVPKTDGLLDELVRVVAPGGRLILGTPDYSTWQWRLLEAAYKTLAPGGYADEHVSHYSRQELIELFQARGFTVEATRYIMHGEVILALRRSSAQN